jgi:hypothetical protein
MMLAHILYKLENFEQLYNEVFMLINKIGFVKNQIMCQSMNESTEDFETGIGSIDDLEHKNEELYKFIQPMLKGSYLEQIISKHNAFRTRILKLTPRSCYSIHRDPTPRIHIPIVTNEQSWMIWPKNSYCINLKKGFVYSTDTRSFHTFLNGDKKLERIHIVMAIK